ncbi:MAG: hypothetical protein ACYTEI_06010 [Planctomycetota bacterium]|jgi:hypothetical protein
MRPGPAGAGLADRRSHRVGQGHQALGGGQGTPGVGQRQLLGGLAQCQEHVLGRTGAPHARGLLVGLQQRQLCEQGGRIWQW